MTLTIQGYLMIFFAIFLAGLIDSVVGGGGLISLPAYLVAGLPPHLATGTNKCSSTFGTLLSTWRFMKNKKMHYKVAFLSALWALGGSYVGAKINMAIDEKYLGYILIALLPLITLFLLLKKDFGKEDRTEALSPQKTYLFSICIGFVIGMYDGFFGPGTGTFLILCYTGLMGFDLITASGNAKVVNLSSNIAAFITFAFSSQILWSLGIPAAFFGVLGNYIGSGLAIKKGAKVIRPMFFVALALLFGKIIYDFLV